MSLSPASRQFVFSLEGFAHKVYVPRNPDQTPMEASGPTLDPGLDLGQLTVTEWHACNYPIPDADRLRLDFCCGKRGAAALAALETVKDIVVPQAAAEAFFVAYLEPLWEQRTQEEFPGAVTLQLNAPDAFGGLFSLTYNRGDQGSHEHRASMLAVRKVVDDLALDERVSRAELVTLGDAVAAQAPNWTTGSTLYRRRITEGAFIQKAPIPGEAALTT